MLLAAALAGAAGCGFPASGPGSPASLPPTQGYILLSIDTLRADHLGCYGYERETSPFLDELAARGILFENAVVQLPGTLPSHMSMLTGLYPAEHGVYPPDSVLSPQIETLPEAFRRTGFRTAGFTEGGYVSGHYGFARGFEEFSDETWRITTDVERTLARGLDFLRRLGPTEPFFLFLHSYVVHDPYFPPEPYAGLFWDGEPPPGAFPPTGPNLVEVNRGERPVTSEAVRYFEALYDAEIRYLDDQLRRFFAALSELPFADRVTVVITSDHGEEFFEHGKLVHEQLYHENLHVPLLLLHPEAPPARVRALVESVDLAPTLLAIAGIESSRPRTGRSLLAAAGDEGDPREAYAEAVDGARALYHQRGESLFKLLLFDPRGPQGGDSNDSGLWVTRSIAFDVAGPRVSFVAHSYGTARTVAMAVDGEPWGEIEIGTTAERFDVELPTDGKASLELSTAECLSPAELGESNDARCLSFRLVGVKTLRTELYDLATDRTEGRDLSRHLQGVEGALVESLQSRRWMALATPGREELDEEQRRRLKALGYLQ